MVLILIDKKSSLKKKILSYKHFTTNEKCFLNQKHILKLKPFCTINNQRGYY